MSEVLYTARVEIEKVAGLHRRARLPTGHTLDFGVHGAIREHYRLPADAELPLPVDALVAALGA